MKSILLYNLVILFYSTSSASLCRNRTLSESLTMKSDGNIKQHLAQPMQNVSVDSIVGKNMVGYQGWFSCKDGYGAKHWASPDLATDMLPDVSEYDPKDLCILSGYQDSNGNPIKVFSSQSPGVVDLHFKWMQKYGIDGAFVQEFFSDMKDLSGIEQRLNVTQNVKASAEKYGRAWAVMFDVSGLPDDAPMLFKKILPYFQDMIRNSTMYLQEHGKPLVAVWGLGGSEGKHITDPKVGMEVIQYLKDQGYSVYGGFPQSKWSENFDEWKELINMVDVLSPWSVGFAGGYDAFKRRTEKEIALLNGTNVIYSPVIYPGFSWHNLKRHEDRKSYQLNQIPRSGGELYRGLAEAAIAAGANNLYTAMFDEVNEGTAIFKTIAKTKDLPTNGNFLALDQDGFDVPSDNYLKLAGHFSQILKK